MKRAVVFSGRNIKELLRDPLSYIFCVGFPVIMLVIMTFVNSVIPPEAGMDNFKIVNLAPGIAVFGLTFIMLFATLTVSKDRSGAFLMRLFSSPMRASDFIIGYTLPFIVVAAGQFVITYISAFIIALITGEGFNLIGALLSFVALLPCTVMFIGMGNMFGTLFGEKAAPPCCSIIISVASILGGIWMDLDTMPKDGAFYKICYILPFSHCVDAARAAFSGNYGDMWKPFLISAAWALGIYALSVVVFRLKMSGDKK